MVAKLNGLKVKKYWFAFVLIMILNAVLTITLIRSVRSQIRANEILNQPPIEADVLRQPGCPLSITVSYVDNTAASHQVVNLDIQNITGKSIRAYVLSTHGEFKGNILTNIFVAKVFGTMETEVAQYPIERLNIRTGDKVHLSVDFVEFVDGSTWGKDSEGKSFEINADREGRRFAIRYIKRLLENTQPEDAKSLSQLLETNVRDFIVEPPDANQSESWRKSFTQGYKSVVLAVQHVRTDGSGAIANKLHELERIAN